MSSPTKADLFTGDYPVVGKLAPWLPGFAGDFGQYTTPTMRGLAQVRGDVIDVLVMDAHVPGQGDGGRFLADLMAAYQTVRVLEVMNPDLVEMLKRRGFVAFAEADGFESVDGFTWTRPHA